MNRVLLLVAVCIAVTSGCSQGPSRILPPAVNPSEAAALALDQYDANGDGALDAAEYRAVPALEYSEKRLDIDSDGRISENEISERIQSWLDSRAALVQVRCLVTLNGKPLPSAQVFLEPEEFLRPHVRPASGTTTDRGIALLSVASEYRQGALAGGANCGLYRVRIIGDGVPVRYSDGLHSDLGVEVAPDIVPTKPYDFEFSLKR